ncbi:MAG: hypothetical protein CSB55_00605 [Candidatus Cloacimonadota bacterium]|nr:MAG: hypothetical protein CSB55_00605 [Candidatus Cloacimonadota bacterium]
MQNHIKHFRDKMTWYLALSFSIPGIIFLLIIYFFFLHAYFKRDAREAQRLAVNFKHKISLHDQFLSELLAEEFTFENKKKLYDYLKKEIKNRNIIISIRAEKELSENETSMWIKEIPPGEIRRSNIIKNNDIYGITVKNNNDGYFICAVYPLELSRISEVDFFKYKKTVLLDKTNDPSLPENFEIRNKIKNILISKSQISVEKEDKFKLNCSFIIYGTFEKPIALAEYEYLRAAVKKMQLLFVVSFSLFCLTTILSSFIFSKFGFKIILKHTQGIIEEMGAISKNPVKFKKLNTEEYSSIRPLAEAVNELSASFAISYNSIKRYKKIIQTVKDGIFQINSDGEILFMNKAFADFFSLQPDKKYYITEFFDPGKTEFPELLSSIPFSGELNFGDKFFLINFSAGFDDKPGIYSGVIVDITTQKEILNAQKKLENQLIQSRRLSEVGLLIEGISHNLNSPLSNLLGYIQLLKEEYPDLKDVQKIFDNGMRMAEIIKTLMDRVSDTEVFAPRMINVNDMINKEIDFFKHNLFFKANVEVKLDLDESLPPVSMIYSDLSQTAANILSNATEAMKDSSKKIIFVKTYRENNFLKISIKDTGHGIPEDKINVIFEPFYSDKGLTDKSGRGLGLSISKQLLKKYGADISAESVYGKGSKFTITLPLNNGIK